MTTQKPLAQDTQPATATSILPADLPAEIAETKAVRLAEEFIVRNGYTDLPPDKTSISHETVEFAENLDQLLKPRHNTLERKAYGLRYNSKMGKRGWTIVFRHNTSDAEIYNQVGRAVYLNENLEVTEIEHKGFPLGNIEKNL